ncbi:MAG TPA: aminotransferase class V-fold PLP-dependent enzyme [Candidatus Acidoferrum sp.]
MAQATTSSVDWRQAWYANDAVVYLNAAGQAPMPRVSLDAVQAALEWKKFPHALTDQGEMALPQRVRTSIANLIGAKPQEIALTTGASAGLMALAYGLSWKPGDEILTAHGEFPAQYTTWKPMEAREGVKLRLIAPREQWITADDFVAALTPKTRVVSVSMVRFDDGSMLEAAKLGAACRAQGTLLALDVSQCCGAIPMNVKALGADFITCSGYKWLLGPYGSGFFWASSELTARFRPGPFYWQGIEGLIHYGDLIFESPKPAAGARGWDASETASYFNLTGWDASLRFLQELGVETVAAHNRKLMTRLFELLPHDRFVRTSPAKTEQQGPYGCFAAYALERTHECNERLKREKVYASLREGNIRVSPHLYNTEQDIDTLIRVIAG